MKIKVLMKWCEASQQWFMYMKDRFIMKFPDCDNMHNIFDCKLNKNKPGKFVVDISEI